SHTTTVLLVVNPVADFSIAATPTSSTVNVGTSTTYSVSTAGFNGFTGNIALSFNGLPAGAAGSFNPATVAVGSTSTLTVTTTTALPAGTYPFSITGASGSLSETMPLTLVANTVPVAGLAPGSLNFASHNVGTTSAAQTVTLTNSGTAALTISSIALSGDFAQTNNCGSTLA